jgi:hypothetical protein
MRPARPEREGPSLPGGRRGPQLHTRFRANDRGDIIDGGKVSLYTQSGTHLIADVVGWYAA